MGTISPDELVKKWAREELTVEMAVGHLSQNLVQLQELLQQLKDSLLKIRKDVDSLIAFTGMPPGKR